MGVVAGVGALGGVPMGYSSFGCPSSGLRSLAFRLVARLGALGTYLWVLVPRVPLLDPLNREASVWAWRARREQVA